MLLLALKNPSLYPLLCKPLVGNYQLLHDSRFRCCGPSSNAWTISFSAFNQKKARPVPDNFAHSLTFIPTCMDHEAKFRTAKLEDLKANEENPVLQFDLPHSCITGENCSAL